jgi:ribosome-binding protein aMBF1 (putative translation factor)
LGSNVDYSLHHVDYNPWIDGLIVVMLPRMGREYDQVRKQLAVSIRSHRLRLGLSQEGLALDADLDRTYVSQLERAKANPSLLVLCKLAVILQIDLSDLISEDLLDSARE